MRCGSALIACRISEARKSSTHFHVGIFTMSIVGTGTAADELSAWGRLIVNRLVLNVMSSNKD